MIESHESIAPKKARVSSEVDDMMLVTPQLGVGSMTPTLHLNPVAMAKTIGTSPSVFKLDLEKKN